MNSEGKIDISVNLVIHQVETRVVQRNALKTVFTLQKCVIKVSYNW